MRWILIILLAAACAAGMACGKKAVPAAQAPDIETGQEMFAFKIGMNPAEFHDAVYRIPNFRREDGTRPWFGANEYFRARCQKFEVGMPEEIEAFFTDQQAKQIDIRYNAEKPGDRATLFSNLYRSAVAGFKEVQCHTNQNGECVYYLNNPDAIGWLFNPHAPYTPISISLRPSLARHKQ